MGVVFGMYGWYALVVTWGFRDQEYVDVVCGGVLNGVCDCLVLFVNVDLKDIEILVRWHSWFLCVRAGSFWRSWGSCVSWLRGLWVRVVCFV